MLIILCKYICNIIYDIYIYCILYYIILHSPHVSQHLKLTLADLSIGLAMDVQSSSIEVASRAT